MTKFRPTGLLSGDTVTTLCLYILHQTSCCLNSLIHHTKDINITCNIFYRRLNIINGNISIKNIKAGNYISSVTFLWDIYMEYLICFPLTSSK